MHFHSSCLFDTGQSLLVDFDLCASTRLVFLTLVSRCRWTLACALPPDNRLGLHLFTGNIGLYNRQQVGVRLFPYRRRHCRRLGGGSDGGGTEKDCL